MPFGYGKFAQDAQCIRNTLVHLDVLALNVRYNDHVRVSKALVMVWMAASVETFWKSYLGELCSRVSTAPVAKRRRHLAAAGIFYFDILGSMGDGKKLRRWGRVADFFIDLPNGTVSPTTIPYDGRTVRPDHLEIAWKVFSLSGAQFPSPIHKQVLNTLADRRNDVAHGLVDPQVVGGAVTVGDLRDLMTKLEDIVDNCVIAAGNKWP